MNETNEEARKRRRREMKRRCEQNRRKRATGPLSIPERSSKRLARMRQNEVTERAAAEIPVDANNDNLMDSDSSNGEMKCSAKVTSVRIDDESKDSSERQKKPAV